MKAVKRMFRGVLLGVSMFFIRMYVYMVAPWEIARFYAAWPKYQRDSVYRQRLTIFGFEKAFTMFLNCKTSRRYMLQLRLKDEPELKWRLWFLPWTIPIPDILETAACEGIFQDILSPHGGRKQPEE